MFTARCVEIQPDGSKKEVSIKASQYNPAIHTDLKCGDPSCGCSVGFRKSHSHSGSADIPDHFFANDRDEHRKYGCKEISEDIKPTSRKISFNTALKNPDSRFRLNFNLEHFGPKRKLSLEDILQDSDGRLSVPVRNLDELEQRLEQLKHNGALDRAVIRFNDMDYTVNDFSLKDKGLKPIFENISNYIRSSGLDCVKRFRPVPHLFRLQLIPVKKKCEQYFLHREIIRIDGKEIPVRVRVHLPEESDFKVPLCKEFEICAVGCLKLRPQDIKAAFLSTSGPKKPVEMVLDVTDQNYVWRPDHTLFAEYAA
jgi:hypothetical protein